MTLELTQITAQSRLLLPSLCALLIWGCGTTSTEYTETEQTDQPSRNFLSLEPPLTLQEEADELKREALVALRRVADLDRRGMHADANSLAAQLASFDLPAELRLFVLEALLERSVQRGHISQQATLSGRILRALTELLAYETVPGLDETTESPEPDTGNGNEDLAAVEAEPHTYTPAQFAHWRKLYREYAADFDRNYSLLAYMHPRQAQSLSNDWFTLYSSTAQPVLIQPERISELDASSGRAETGEHEDPLFAELVHYWLAATSSGDAESEDAPPDNASSEIQTVLLPELSEASVEATQPSIVRVFLPLSGSLSQASLLIQRGLLNTLFQANFSLFGNSRLQLEFHDTTEINSEEEWRNLLRLNAVAYIGPLQKQKIEEYISVRREFASEIPTLVLNHVSQEDSDLDLAGAQVWQLGLPIEDEVEALLVAARDSGACNLLVLIGDDSLSERRSRAATTATSQGVCSIIADLMVSPQSAASTIAEFFGITDSNRRASQLTNRLAGENPTHTFWRRYDVDAVLMLANQEQVEAILPGLDYAFASNLPTYLHASSVPGNIQERLAKQLLPIAEPLNDATLDATSLPLPARTTTSNQIDTSDSEVRLVALGTDALRTLSELIRVQQPSVTTPSDQVSDSDATVSTSQQLANPSDAPTLPSEVPIEQDPNSLADSQVIEPVFKVEGLLGLYLLQKDENRVQRFLKLADVPSP